MHSSGYPPSSVPTPQPTSPPPPVMLWCHIGSQLREVAQRTGINALGTKEQRSAYLAEVLYVRSCKYPDSTSTLPQLIEREIAESGWEDVTVDDVNRNFRYLCSLARDLGPVADTYAQLHRKRYGIILP